MRGLRAAVALVVAFFALLALSQNALAADAGKTLRIASADIDTLDPHQYNDRPSYDVICALYEGLYEWDYLRSPAHLAPVAATALPVVSADGRTWTMHVRPGVRFGDDPAFGGRPRELTADDIVYSLKRWLDPNLRRGGSPETTDVIVGARAVVDAASKAGGRFDYDAPIEGLRALDRYTVQLKLNAPNYPVIEAFLVTGAVAREVVEAAGGDIRTRVAGTGPYRLKEWRRGSRIVLEANPQYRPTTFPPSRDARDAPLEQAMKGRALPRIGIVDISVIEEDIARLLEFDKGHLDYVSLRGEVANRLLDGAKLRPEYANRGIAHHAFVAPYLTSLYFNVADPVVGGMTKERIALRRAIRLAIDAQALVDVVSAGSAIPANQMVPPGVGGHDPSLPPRQPHDPAAAKALLDRFGYTIRDASGYRSAPDGKPLTVTLSLRSGAVSRELSTLIRRNLDAIGIRSDFHVTPFQDIVKELEGGRFQTAFIAYGGNPSGYGQLLQLDSRAPTTVNASRFRLPEYDRAMDRFMASASAAGQAAAARRMYELVQAYAPTVPLVFRIENNFVQPWVDGFAPMRFQTYWKYLDVDAAKRQGAQR